MPVEKNLPSSIRDSGSILVQGTKISHDSEQVRPCAAGPVKSK